MCYYVTINVSKKESIKVKTYDVVNGNATLVKPLQNGFSYAPWPIIKSKNDTLELTNAHWEFISNWNKDWNAVKESRKKYTTLNAKGETLFESKLYKDAAATKRCLVVVSGFFEWREIKLTTSKKAVKVPYFIYLPEKEYFFIAGIYNNWLDTETGEVIENFALVTTAANSLMAQIHNTQKRMPVILNNDQAVEWLHNKNIEEIKTLALSQYPAHNMCAYTIEKDFRTMPNPTTKVDYEVVPALEN